MDADAIIPMHQLDVADLAPDARFAAFASLVRNSRVTRPAIGPFDVEARFWRLGAVLVSEQRFDAVTFDRTSAEAITHDSDHYSVVVCLAGTCTFDHGGERRTLYPGRVGFSDFTMAERVETTALHSITIQIARPVLDQAVSPISARGPLPDSPELRLLASFSRTLVDLLPTMTTPIALRMADVLRDLLAAGLIGLATRSDDRLDSSVRQRVVRHIAAQPNGSVTVTALCDALHLTRSSLFRAFKAHGGVLAYDRRRRLHALHQALTDPSDRRGIAELGFHYGFEDKTHLSRVFRKTFGYSASELRDHPAIAQHREPAAGSVQERYRSSVAALTSANFV